MKNLHNTHKTLTIYGVDAARFPQLRGDIVRHWCADDERWFQKNAGAPHRDRLYQPGELGPRIKFAAGTRLRVWRVAPFMFARLPLSAIDHEERGQR